MTQNCVYCQCVFDTNGKRVTCSQRCAGYLSRQNAAMVRGSASASRTALPPTSALRIEVVKAEPLELPPIETLPAAYVKRVHDLWESLIGDAPMRIA